jgi:hypothetical protein
MAQMRQGWYLFRVGFRQVALLVFLVAALSAPVSALAASPPNPDPLDPDTAASRAGNDALWVITNRGQGHYQLVVENTSGIGFIDKFSWVPPASMTVTKVSNTTAGKCNLAGGAIACTLKLKPPKCTCRAGGIVTIDFTASGNTPKMQDGHLVNYGVVGSYLRIVKMTPVPYPIPSWIGPGGAAP